MACMGRKPPSPFKFVSSRMMEVHFTQLVKEKWAPFNRSSSVSVALQFEENMKRIKKEYLHWEHENKIK